MQVNISSLVAPLKHAYWQNHIIHQNNKLRQLPSDAFSQARPQLPSSKGTSHPHGWMKEASPLPSVSPLHEVSSEDSSRAMTFQASRAPDSLLVRPLPDSSLDLSFLLWVGRTVLSPHFTCLQPEWEERRAPL